MVKNKINVIYASASEQKIFSISVSSVISLEEAIYHSGILQAFPEINLAQNKVGIFGKVKKLTDFAFSGDQIEIYRPLLIDPKEGRRKKATQKIN